MDRLFIKGNEAIAYRCKKTKREGNMKKRNIGSKKVLSVLMMTSMTVSTVLTGCGSSTTATTATSGTAASGATAGAQAAASVSHDEELTLDVYDVASNFQGEQTGWFGKIIKDKFNLKLNIVAPQVAGDPKSLYQT